MPAGRWKQALQLEASGLRGRLSEALAIAVSSGLRAGKQRAIDRALADGVLSVGRHSYGLPIVHRYAGTDTNVTIGSFVAIADDVEFLPAGEHRTDTVASFPLRYRFNLPGALEDGVPFSKGAIRVGSDVWIGRGAKILSGVEIGNGAVIGAYSVVARDVAPYSIVVGNPAREVKKRFSDDVIAELQEIAWWEWKDEDIIDCVDLLASCRISEFVKVAKERFVDRARTAEHELPRAGTPA